MKTPWLCFMDFLGISSLHSENNWYCISDLMSNKSNFSLDRNWSDFVPQPTSDREQHFQLRSYLNDCSVLGCVFMLSNSTAQFNAIQGMIIICRVAELRLK